METITDWFLDRFLLLSASSLVLVSICLSNTLLRLSVTPLTTDGSLLALYKADNVSSICWTVSSAESYTRLELVSSVPSRLILVSGGVLLNNDLSGDLEEIVGEGDLDDDDSLQISNQFVNVLTVLTTLDTLENDSKADVDNLDLFGDFNKL